MDRGWLPTEAEWEYATRGGSAEARYRNLADIGWDDRNRQLHEVAQKGANGFGLYDMLGNVAEWVSDWYDEHYYQSRPSQAPPGPAAGEKLVLRGGGVRVSSRSGGLFEGESIVGDGGFRCAGEVVNP